MRVGIYVDAFNVYYGGRDLCGRGAAGWRWLDLASLSHSLLDARLWPGAAPHRLVYCTAHRDRAGDPSSIADQQTYITALRSAATPTTVVYGQYVPRVKSGDLVDRRGKRVSPPENTGALDWLPLWTASGPEGTPVVRGAVSTFEEKGSDVNVATHLLVDVLTAQVDAAIVFSNDSDLELPIREARQRVPVGTVNPGVRQTGASLRGSPDDGVGRHWWRRLNADDFYLHQLSNPTGGKARPLGW